MSLENATLDRAILERFSGSTVLVTGGAGMIGSRMVGALAGVAEVTVLDDLSSGQGSVPADVRFIRGSILEPQSLRSALNPVPDYVVHLAALFANQNSVEHPEQDLLVNGMGTLRVLDASLDAGVQAIVYSSSSCVYGSQGGVLSEDMAPGDLHTPYAVTKHLGEEYLRYFATISDPAVTRLSAVRYFNVYGPGEMPGPYRNVIPNFVSTALAGQELVITGSGEETRDFTFVDDAVGGTLQALLFGRHGAVYNLGTGRETRIDYLADTIVGLTSSAAPVRRTGRRSWDKTTARRADIGRAEAELGYAPTVSLEQGLEVTVAWLKEAGAGTEL